MTVPFIHVGNAIGGGGLRPFLQLARVQAQAHRPAHVGDRALVQHQVDDGVLRPAVELRGIGFLQVEHVAGKFHAHDLHPQAQAEVGHLLLAGVARRQDLAFDAARSEPAGHDDAVGALHDFPALVLFEVSRVDPGQVHLHAVGQGGVLDRFTHRHVGILQFDVFPDQRDPDRGLGFAHFGNQFFPGFHVWLLPGAQTEFFQYQVAHAAFFQHQRDFVQYARRFHRDNGALLHVAEQRDLVAQAFVDGIVGARDDKVGRDADGTQGRHRVLGGLGLHFARRADGRQPGDMHEQAVLASHLVAELAQRFEERLRLDVADRAADLQDDDLRARLLGGQPDPTLDLVGDVGDDLDGAAQVVAAPLLRDDLGVDLPSGEVADPPEADVDEAFVVAQVQVGLGAVIQHVDLAVLVGTHRARVHVDVRIQLLHGHLETAFLEQQAGRRGRHALADRTDHAACKEKIFCRHVSPQLVC